MRETNFFQKIFSGIYESTEEKEYVSDMEAQIKAINRSQAVIEFDMSGIILKANENFLNLMGYTLPEIKGRHHSMFVTDEYKHSEDYQSFWRTLNRGEFISAEFERLAKGGRNVWIQGSYNPVFNSQGELIKVVKFASDISEKKLAEKKFSDMVTELQFKIKIYREFIAQVSSGDLTHMLEIKGDDDLSVLGTYLNEMTTSLAQIAKRIINVGESMNNGMTKLNENAASQASGAAEQATSVAEIGSIIEEITNTSKQTLEKAMELGDSAEQTMKEGENGKIVINRVLEETQTLQEKMKQISSTIVGLSDKTQQIGEITDAVSDIAKQSKMLALNASIEAAKAGESGRGFAVVADEVKDLAERSQTSTEKVQNILQDIRKTAEQAVVVTEDGMRSVDANLKQAQSSSEIIGTLGDVIEKTTSSSQQIVAAVREESVGISQVVESIREIDKATSMFTSMTEDNKQSILQFTEIMEQLKDTMSKYKINKDRE